MCAVRYGYIYCLSIYGCVTSFANDFTLFLIRILIEWIIYIWVIIVTVVQHSFVDDKDIHNRCEFCQRVVITTVYHLFRQLFNRYRIFGILYYGRAIGAWVRHLVFRSDPVNDTPFRISIWGSAQDVAPPVGITSRSVNPNERPFQFEIILFVPVFVF